MLQHSDSHEFAESAATTDAQESHQPPVRAGKRPNHMRLRAWRDGLLDQRAVGVSVCIANWNCRDLLRTCLQSLLDQPQGVRLEVIVVDNDSADGAAQMVEEEFPEVLLLRNPHNAGFATANNQAARRAQGRYLFFLNNDTVVPAGALARLVDFAEAHPEAGIIGPSLRDGNGHVQVSYRQHPGLGTLLHRTSLLRVTGLLHGVYQRYRREDFDPLTTRRVDVLMGAAMLIPRTVFEECGGWDGSFAFGGEDLDLSARVGSRHGIFYHPAVEITHFGRASSRQHIGYVSSNMAVGFVRYLRKCGYSEATLWLYKAVVTVDAPLQLLGKALQYSWRRFRGQHAKAQKSLLALRGTQHFLARGLTPFWRA